MPFSPKVKQNLQRAAAFFQNSLPQKKENFIRRLLMGEYSLTRTFWFFCLSIPLAGDLVFSYLFFPLLDLSMPRDRTALLIWVLAISFYMLVANLGLWRSATRCPKREKRLLGKVASVLGILAALAYIARWYAIWMLVSA